MGTARISGMYSDVSERRSLGDRDRQASGVKQGDLRVWAGRVLGQAVRTRPGSRRRSAVIHCDVAGILPAIDLRLEREDVHHLVVGGHRHFHIREVQGRGVHRPHRQRAVRIQRLRCLSGLRRRCGRRHRHRRPGRWRRRQIPVHIERIHRKIEFHRLGIQVDGEIAFHVRIVQRRLELLDWLAFSLLTIL